MEGIGGKYLESCQVSTPETILAEKIGYLEYAVNLDTIGFVIEMDRQISYFSF